MLIHLTIRNVAIIEEVSINFSEGFHVFTGETGAGKSILIDALLLALGGRSSTDLLRTGAEEAEVSALFCIDDMPELQSKIREIGIPVEDGELLLRRAITASGRSRAYINDCPVTAKFLRESGQKLVEISGQHEHQHLMQPRYHLDLLDNYGELWAERQRIAEQYALVRNMHKRLQTLGGDALRRRQRKDYLQYQISELSDADLDVNEESLQQQRRYLLQFGQMVEASQNADMVLYSGPNSLTEQLGRLRHRFETWRELSTEIANTLQNLLEAEALVDDAARTLRGFLSNADIDKSSLRDIEQQLSRLRDLKRKHGANTIDGLTQKLQQYIHELEELDRRETEMQQLEADYVREVEVLRQIAWSLSEQRKAVAVRLCAEVESELASVGMKKAKFVVAWETSPPPANGNTPSDDRSPSLTMSDESHSELHTPVTEHDDTFSEAQPVSLLHRERDLPGPHGFDQVQFLLSSNPGEEPKSLHRIASGGELSRIMLALKQIIAEREPVPTCIFDEVDAGIGGNTAHTIALKIRDIAQQRQVICVTHLAQIACLADHHYAIQKSEIDGRTLSRINPLTPTEREYEIARMLGGIGSNPQILAHAREILSQAHLTNVKYAHNDQNTIEPNNSNPRSTRNNSPN